MAMDGQAWLIVLAAGSPGLSGSPTSGTAGRETERFLLQWLIGCGASSCASRRRTECPTCLVEGQGESPVKKRLERPGPSWVRRIG
jgi:hypothetical protein